MSDSNPDENKSANDNISDQLHELGKNLREMLQTAWESDERKKMQIEIEEGLANLGASLSQAAKDFENTPTGKSLKEDMKDMQERWRTGEMRSKVHTEIVDVLRKVNDELQKTTKKPPTD